MVCWQTDGHNPEGHPLRAMPKTKPPLPPGENRLLARLSPKEFERLLPAACNAFRWAAQARHLRGSVVHRLAPTSRTGVSFSLLWTVMEDGRAIER